MKRGFRRTREDYVIDGIVYTILIVVMIATIYPFYYSLIISLNNGIDASRGGSFYGRACLPGITMRRYSLMTS